jgi:hypothetical protein
MKDFYKAEFEVTPNMLDIEHGYDEAAIQGLFTRCAVCGRIKTAELFYNFIDDKYALCGTCLEKIKKLIK